MSNGLIHGLIAVLVVLLGVVYLRAGKRRPSYRLTEKWTHAPILWAATDEVIPGGGPDGRHGESALTVGGGASGGW